MVEVTRNADKTVALLRDPNFELYDEYGLPVIPSNYPENIFTLRTGVLKNSYRSTGR